MAYLSKDDYSLRIQRKHLNDILSQAATQTGFKGDDILEDAELTAEAEIRAFLTDVYEIEAEFNKTGNSRNRLIMKCYLDMVLYEIHFVLAPTDIPVGRKNQYEKCRSMLDMMRQEEINPGLPLVAAAELARNTELFSNDKFIFHPHDDMSIAKSTTVPKSPIP